MKKYLLSAFVTISFIFYSIGQKNQVVADNKTFPVAAKKSPTPTSGWTTSSLNLSNSPFLSAKITNSPVPTKIPNNSGYHDGVFTGSSADAFYGYVQVSVSLNNGLISDVNFLQYPNDRGHSIMINNYAMPILSREAIQAQSGKVDIVSGATDTSLAFRQSFASALLKAR